MKRIGDILNQGPQPKTGGTPPRTPGTQPRDDEPSQFCEHCGGYGLYTLDVPVGHPEFGRAQTCECQRERIERQYREYLLAYCELPRGTVGMTFSTFRRTTATQAAFDAACEFLVGSEQEDGRYMLTLAGPTGTGKTHLAVAIVRQCLELQRPARYVYVPLLLAELRAGFRDERDNYVARMQRLSDVQLLVLDDLGAEQQTDWAGEQLDMIVDRRYLDKRQMVVTTNLAPRALAPRIASRLQDRRWGHTVAIKAPDYRLTRRNE